MDEHSSIFIKESEMNIPLVGKRTCNKCGEIKNVNQFSFSGWKILSGGIRGKYLRHKCRDCKTKQSMMWAKNNYSRHLKNTRIWTRKRHRELRRLAVNKLRKTCRRCGFSDYRALQIDHVNADGAKERKVDMINSRSLYKKVLKDNKGRYQLLCANCNWIKRVENNEQNHYA